MIDNSLSGPNKQSITSGQHNDKDIFIQVSELSKRFNREWIFKKFTCTFLPGNVYAVTGPNGSGKSTLLHILWGQTPATSGTLTYSYNNMVVDPGKIFEHVTIAAPYMDLIDEFTLWEQLNFHFKLRKIRDNMSLEKALDEMQLVHARNKYIGNFSSGMKQRVKLALAFFTDTKVIFLDEPGTNLDKSSFEWYQFQLKKLPSDSIIFIATNQPDEYPENSVIIDILRFK